MNFIKKIFGKKEDKILNYQDFWKWFEKHEKTFFEAIRGNKNIEKVFFDKLSPQLAKLKDGFFYLVGMADDNTVELILTPDGNVKNIIFVEELVAAAPPLTGWKFIALKPAFANENFEIQMQKYVFSAQKLSFYANKHSDFPDEIDLVLVYEDYKEEDKSLITNGVFVFIDNFLGELNAITNVDNILVIGKEAAEEELIPINKLKSYLFWREKEFLEKYESKRYNTKDDVYAVIKGEFNDESPFVAIVNSVLLDWDAKASHQWILKIDIKYKGNPINGMPDDATYQQMDSFENELNTLLIDVDGYLNVGRLTMDNTREIYFACHDFRLPSKVLHEKSKEYADRLHFTFEIYKDKYWQTFEMFRVN